MEEKSDVKQSKPSRRRPRPAGAARARVAHQVCIFLRHVREGARGRKRGRGESVFRVCVCVEKCLWVCMVVWVRAVLVLVFPHQLSAFTLLTVNPNAPTPAQGSEGDTQ